MSGTSLRLIASILAIGSLMTGCVGPDTMLDESGPDRVGRTYYIDAAGNWGFGTREIPAGLQRAGYQGRIINYRWSPTLNPLLDQTLGRVCARRHGAQLGEEITEYLRQVPESEVNIIALSAGTGVAVWACETIRPPARIRNLILLGSSLSNDYDMREALARIAGGVWVYHSRTDAILEGPVRILGTIDGRLGVESAGSIGLHPAGGPSPKIHNIAWQPEDRSRGWTGAHTDATSELFVRLELAAHIVTTPPQVAGFKPDQRVVTAAAHIPATQPAAGITARQ